MTTQILLVDDHRLLRESLRAILEHDSALAVIGEASSGREAVQLARELSPDVVVMDVGMRDLNGIEATRQICAENATITLNLAGSDLDGASGDGPGSTVRTSTTCSTTGRGTWPFRVRPPTWR